MPVPVPVCRCRCRCRCRSDSTGTWGAGAGAGFVGAGAGAGADIGTLFACNRHPQSVFLIFITGKNRLTTPFFTLDQFSDFFTGENRFSLHYFSTFLMFYMSKFFTPVLNFFQRLEIRFSPAKFWYFSFSCIFFFSNFFGRNQDQQIFLHGHFLLFVGVIFDFFHGLDFNFYGCKLTKRLTGKTCFHGHFLGIFDFFTNNPPSFMPKK